MENYIGKNVLKHKYKSGTCIKVKEGIHNEDKYRYQHLFIKIFFYYETKQKLFQNLEGHDDMIICLDFDKYDGLLVTSSLDNTLRIWDLSNKKCLGLLDSHHGLSIKL